jgi:NUMOD4 motif/HNH endonuclease
MPSSAEYWKGIPEWEDLYEASSKGRIRSLGSTVPSRVGTAYRKGRVLAPATKPNGYLAVSLARDGKHFQFHIHRLVAWTFLGPQPPKVQVRHLNGEKEDCQWTNLAYGTPKENDDDKKRHGTHARGETHGMAKLTNLERAAIACSTLRSRVLAEMYGVTRDHARSLQRKHK